MEMHVVTRSKAHADGSHGKAWYGSLRHGRYSTSPHLGPPSLAGSQTIDKQVCLAFGSRNNILP